MPAFAITWQVAATILVLSRFYLRARKQAGPFGLDDVFMLIAWAVAVGFTACACISTLDYGVDRHIWDIQYPLWPTSIMIGWIAQILNVVSTGATKMSVLLFYRRMVVDTFARRWRWAIYAALGFNAFNVCGVLLALFTVCRPLDAYWKSFNILSYNKSYGCTPATVLNPIIGVISVLTDLYAVVLPCLIFRYYELDIPRRQKIVLNCVFAAGLLVVGAGIAKTYYLVRLGYDYDVSWTGFSLYVWSITECQLAIICACAPSLRAFFRRYLSDAVQRSLSGSFYQTNQSHGESAARESLQRPYQPDRKNIEALDMRELTKPSIEDMAMERRAGWESDVPASPTDGTRSFRTVRTSSIAWETRRTRPLSIISRDFTINSGVQEIHGGV